MNSLRSAVGFLTILPVGNVSPTGAARAWFPSVGLMLGACLVGIDAAAREGLPPLVVGALLLAALLILTRGLHMEGWLDCCDGLFGGFTREDRLRILRDTHVGAFAVIGGGALLILLWSLLAGAPDAGGPRIGLLLVFPCLSRFGMVAAMQHFPYARADGLGSAFHAERRWPHALFAGATAALAGGLALGPGGLILWGGVFAAALLAGRWIASLLGGLTGDAYGAINQLGEATALTLGVALTAALPSLFDPIIW